MRQIVDLELFMRVKSGWRRIALLPDVDDALHEAIMLHYGSPRYQIRLLTRIW